MDHHLSPGHDPRDLRHVLSREYEDYLDWLENQPGHARRALPAAPKARPRTGQAARIFLNGLALCLALLWLARSRFIA